MESHIIDFHCVTGPGGGSPCLFAESGQTKRGMFKLLNPGLFIYHCAAAPVPAHVANGMYGLILVEPEGGLSAVDKEFYVMQSEWYTQDLDEKKKTLTLDYEKGLREDADVVTFNGREGALTEKPLLVNQGDNVRIFFGNAGPNLLSSFHIIGGIFDKVYREGDLVSPPASQTCADDSCAFWRSNCS
jgi:FtsP/CotA-like multicopper oxidase with cupredoxin domain